MQVLRLLLISLLILLGMMVLVISLWMLSFRGIDLLDESGNRVIHTQQVKTALWDLEKQFFRLSIAEIGTKEIPLHTEPVSTEAFENIIKGKISELKRLTIDSPIQQEHLGELSSIIDSYFLNLRNKGPESDPTKAALLFEQIQNIFQKISKVEDSLLAKRTVERDRRFRDGRLILSSIVTLCAILIVISFWAILRYSNTSERDKEFLLEAKRDAMRVNDAKSSFIANMSHEIRTPMTAILGYADFLLIKQASPSERFELIQHIRRNGEHLLQIINDILDISKIEANKFVIDEHTVELPSLLEEVASVARQRAIEKNLTLDIRYTTPLPKFITTDALRVKQILINLIGNAAKFTEQGGITLMVEAKDEKLSCHISDTGIGIDKEQLKTLFQPFTYDDSSTPKTYGGSGLGLAISKSISELLGGELKAQSQRGIGSTFSLILPLKAVGDETFQDVKTLNKVGEQLIPKCSADSEGRGKVLLVEDSIDNQNIIVHHLQVMGLNVEVVDNGRKAINRALEQKDIKKEFDLILMDMQLPEVDGYTAVSILRSKGYHGPIAALTANVLDTDRKRCLSVGCNAFLGKPLHLKEFYNTIAQYIPSPSQKEPGNKTGADQSSDFFDLRRAFVKGLAAKKSELETHIEHNNSMAIEKFTHQLAGSAANYNFSAISEQSMEIKDALRAGASLDSLDHKIKLLLAAINEGMAEDSPPNRTREDRLI